MAEARSAFPGPDSDADLAIIFDDGDVDGQGWLGQVHLTELRQLAR